MAHQLSDKLAETAMHEARLLLALALGREAPVLTHEDITFDALSCAKLQELIEARLSGVPVSRLRGWREFYGLRFGLNADTLDPRPDSEVLVDSALAFATDMGWQTEAISLVDFGTGSGCLLLSCLHELPEAHGVGIDISNLALGQAVKNANYLEMASRAKFLHSDWDEHLGTDTYHIILSNPPYIETGDHDSLSDEVRLHDPHRALFAGADGLDDYRRLMPIIAARLKADGQAFIELGYGQAEAVSNLASEAGLQIVNIQEDLAGIPRCLIVRQH